MEEKLSQVQQKLRLSERQAVAMELAGAKLPVKTKFVSREG